jgi:hypothetical protein
VDEKFGGWERCWWIIRGFVQERPEVITFGEEGLVGEEFGGHKVWWVESVVGKNVGGCLGFGGLYVPDSLRSGYVDLDSFLSRRI